MHGTHISDASCGKAMLRRDTVKHFLANLAGLLATGFLLSSGDTPAQSIWLQQFSELSSCGSSRMHSEKVSQQTSSTLKIFVIAGLGLTKGGQLNSIMKISRIVGIDLPKSDSHYSRLVWPKTPRQPNSRFTITIAIRKLMDPRLDRFSRFSIRIGIETI